MMTKRFPFLCLMLSLSALIALAQTQSSPVDPTLKARVPLFELTNQTFFEGIARLSAEPISLAFEEELQARANSSQMPDPRFSLKLENSSVREVLDALCSRDTRYTWSMDGSTINVYPKATDADPFYLLNRRLEKIEFKNVNDPYQALNPIARQLPAEQIGYLHLGGEVRFAQPWTVSFENLTIRQIINRVTAHLGTGGGWTLSGSKASKFFTFHKGEFSRLEASGK